MLVVPFAFDQFDHGDRVHRLGIGEVIPAARYEVPVAAARLRAILQNPQYAQAAAAAADRTRDEDGTTCAAKFIENCISQPANKHSSDANS
jgi:UDP:flavonoid glycosyltransferase YjiC (YdhE family)